MSDFDIGEKVTSVAGGRVHVFTVERIRGNMVCGSHYEARLDLVRRWQPGDDEEAQRRVDQDLCSWFDRWRDLSAEDAAVVAKVLLKYLPERNGEEDP